MSSSLIEAQRQAKYSIYVDRIDTVANIAYLVRLVPAMYVFNEMAMALLLSQRMKSTRTSRLVVFLQSRQSRCGKYRHGAVSASTYV